MSGGLLVSYIALWVLVVALAIAVLALYNHFGRLYLNTPQGRDEQGPTSLEPLRKQILSDLQERVVSLPIKGTPSLLFFSDVDCPLCDSLKPGLARFATQRDGVALTVICGGKREAVVRWSTDLETDVCVVPDPGNRIAAGFNVAMTPFLVATDAEGIVRHKGLINDAEGFEAAAAAAAGTNVLEVITR
jgi:hypothetical protein